MLSTYREPLCKSKAYKSTQATTESQLERSSFYSRKELAMAELIATILYSNEKFPK